MKQHAFDGTLPNPATHDVPVFTPRGDFELRENAGRIHHQASDSGPLKTDSATRAADPCRRDGFALPYRERDGPMAERPRPLLAR